MKTFIKALFSGIIITIAAIAYLTIEEKIVGAFIFNIALCTIVTYELNLYTGKIGYILENGLDYVKKMIIITIGNIMGTVLTALLALQTRNGEALMEKAKYYADIKLGDDIVSILILSIFCGILMYIGVHGYKHIKHEIAKYLVMILCVMTFILAGFEHSIANTVYFTLAGSWSVTAVGYLALMLLGNAIGAIGVSLLNKEYKDLKEKKKELKK